MVHETGTVRQTQDKCMFTIQLMSHHVTLDPQKTVSYFAKRCEQILDLAVKWAPTETKAILEVRRGIPQCILL